MYPPYEEKVITVLRPRKGTRQNVLLEAHWQAHWPIGFAHGESDFVAW
jgi:hypothetical protein